MCTGTGGCGCSSVEVCGCLLDEVCGCVCSSAVEWGWVGGGGEDINTYSSSSRFCILLEAALVVQLMGRILWKSSEDGMSAH